MITLLFISASNAYDPNKVHPTPQILDPIGSKPDALVLTASEEVQLRSGESLLRQQKGSNGGRGVAVQYINAPASKVWETILDYPQYPNRVKNVVECTVYQRASRTDEELLFVEMISSVWSVKIGLYTVNKIRKKEGYMHWYLDRRKESDAKDLVGYWRVEELSTNPPLTRVDHSTEMVVSGVPGFIADYLTKDALVSGTAWVKKYSEQ